MNTALIVGASRGLGLGLSEELAKRGWQVIATARQPDAATGLRELAARSNGGVEIEQIDINVPEQLDALATRLAGRSFDLLLLNAGIAGSLQQTVLTATPEEVSTVMWTNALSPVRIATRLLPQVAEGGTVAFMTSLLGSVQDNTSGGLDLYRISKASLNMLSRSFAVARVEGRNITVLSLHPGWVRTAMGGPGAPLTVAESVKGLADVLEVRRPKGHYFLDYRGQGLPW